MARAVVVAESCAEALFIGRERWWRGRGRWPAGELRGRPLMALGVAVATRFAVAVQATGRLGQGPSGALSIPGAWCAWGHSGARVQRVGREPPVSREQEGEEGRKEKGKRGKGEKEKETPAEFAATVASRAWRRREATRTRNKENRESLNDD